MKSHSIFGVLVSKPVRSSIPPSLGSAMVALEAMVAMTAIFAGMPVSFR